MIIHEQMKMYEHEFSPSDGRREFSFGERCRKGSAVNCPKKKKKKNRLLDDIRCKEKPFLEVTEIM